MVRQAYRCSVGPASSTARLVRAADAQRTVLVYWCILTTDRRIAEIRPPRSPVCPGEPAMHMVRMRRLQPVTQDNETLLDLRLTLRAAEHTGRGG